MRRAGAGVAFALVLSVTSAGPAWAAPTRSPSAKDPLEQALRDRKLVAVKMQATGGHRPTFSWKAVPGASSYLLSVRTKQDEPLWAWSGEETKVRLGAALGAVGPRIARSSVAQVFALGADGALVGISKLIVLR